MRLLNPPEHWLVELKDGSVVDVWADSAEGLAGEEDRRDYLFANLMEMSPDDQAFFEVIGTTPSNPQRVVVAVAHFKRDAVRAVRGAS